MSQLDTHAEAARCALDVALESGDVQDLHNADALAGWFARLGYDTNPRTEQTPGNLGIVADTLVRQIRRVELIADCEGFFQVYLFELTSVTAANSRALSRAFRNRAGNYLLVLTSDFERLDFVFLERYFAGRLGGTNPLTAPQSGVRPRILTVDRRSPGKVELRVLRRFTWTELDPDERPDPFAQYEKLLSAYAVAEWSEEHFNNRALFSDHYLRFRAVEHPLWQGDPKPAYTRLRELYQGASRRLGGRGEDVLRRELLEPVLGTLGFHATRVRPGTTRSGRGVPDYRLYAAKADPAPLALCLVYPWGRSLDGKDEQRDKATPDENPGAVVVSLLAAGDAPWAILTNGKVWRLYAARAHSRATNYYEIDVEELLAQTGPYAGDYTDAFRYFWNLFRREAFERAEVEREGVRQALSFLDLLLLESEEYAKELGERLKGRVFEEIFPFLAEGFIADIRRRDGAAADLAPPVLEEVFSGTLTLLYRLLFLLYAESRGLLPVRETRGYYEASLKRLKEEVAEAAGTIEDHVPERLAGRYAGDSYVLYERLQRLFKAIDKGDASLNVPMYNGGLFLSEPAPDDETPEAAAAAFLGSTRVPDAFLARALDRLSRDLDAKSHGLVFIDYKSLGVRQLGSIYEGLLEFKVRIAAEPMAVVQGKRTEEIVPLGEAERDGRKVLTSGRGNARLPRVKERGAVYLENDKRERKATGSYYTPDHIVEYIVEQAVGPVLEAKFEAMRPRLREAEQERRAFLRRQEALRKQGMRTEPEHRADLVGAGVVNELFDVKVLDPAMGSGHFLVQAVDFITDRTLHFLNGFGWNPVFVELARMRETIIREAEEKGITIDAGKLTDVNLLKRHVLKRCIYGVDLNPMAVELAKVSLWLDCFTLGAPLSFLDHHLRCGNSLVGVSVGEVQEALEERQGELFTSRFAGLLSAAELMRHVGELSDVTGEQVATSRTEYRRAADALLPFKRILDVYTSQWFGNGGSGNKGKGKGETPALALLKSRQVDAFLNARTHHDLDSALLKLPPSRTVAGKTLHGERDVARMAITARDDKHFFHWELEFPEVFYGSPPGAAQAATRNEGAGFDAVIGNPPYDVLAAEELGYDVSDDLAFFNAQQVFKPSAGGKSNLYKLFICRSVSLLSRSGTCSFIVPMALLGDEQAAGVRRLLLGSTRLREVEAFPQKDDARKRVFPEAKQSTCIFVADAENTGRFTVRTHPGRWIGDDSPTLSATAAEVIRLDPENAPIMACTQRDWEIASCIKAGAHIRRLGEFCTAYQGEVNETTDTRKGFISKDPSAGPLVLRGAAITLYVVREASQGEAIYLRKEKFITGKPASEKSRHHQQRRVGWQESAAQNNFRRIIAALIPEGEFCNHKINYIPENSSRIDVDLLLAMLNSKLAEWFFRLSSTNAAVSHYQIYNLPSPAFPEGGDDVAWQAPFTSQRWTELGGLLAGSCVTPGVLPSSVAEALSAMSRRIQEIESARSLKNRSERSHLSPESQPIQDAIDTVLFRCYGVSDEDAAYIRQRLTEML